MRRRIRAVKSTQQITKAMKMVAASKLRRAQERVVATRPFAREARRVLASIAVARRSDDASAAARGGRAPTRAPTLRHRDHVRPRPVRQLQHEHRQGRRRVPAREPRPADVARPGRPQGPRHARPPRAARAVRARQPAEGHRVRRGGGDRRAGGAGLHRGHGRQRLPRSTTSSSR